jgi:hypothetical protein
MFRDRPARQVPSRAGHSSAAFTYDSYSHLLPEADTQAAAKLEAVRPKGIAETIAMFGAFVSHA